MTLADLGAAAVAGVLALVPAAVVLLGVDAIATRLDLGTRLGRTGRRVAATAIGLGVGGAAIGLTWSFAGANYLKPRCVAFAAPVYAEAEAAGDAAPLAATGLRLDAGGELPAWATALTGPAGFAFIELRGADGRLTRVPAAAARTARILLRVRRSSRRVNAWVELWTDRFTVSDRVTGAALARGSEMWVEAGPATWRCGVASGPRPVRVPAYADPTAVRAFVLAAARPAVR